MSAELWVTSSHYQGLRLTNPLCNATVQQWCQIFSAVWTWRWLCCCVQRTVVTWVHRNIIVLATAARLESLCCQWGRVVVVVDCWAVECDHSASQRPTRDLHCPLISDEADTWRQGMISVDDQWRLLRSPTDTQSHWHMLTVTIHISSKYYANTNFR